MTKVAMIDALGANAGEARGERIAAGRVDRTAEAGARKDELGDDREHQRQHDDRRDAEDARRLEPDEDVRHRGDVLCRRNRCRRSRGRCVIVASVAIRAGIFSLVIARPLTRPKRAPQPIAAMMRDGGRAAVELDETDREHRRQHQHGGHRKVDAGDQDDEGLADRDDGDDGRRLEHVLDVADGHEDRAGEAHDHAAETG